MNNKIIAAVVIVAVTVITAALAVNTAYAAELQDSLRQKLEAAVAADRPAEAAQWAQALAGYKTAQLADEQREYLKANNEVLRIMMNGLRSIPAVVAEAERFCRETGDLKEGGDSWFFFKAASIGLKLADRPLAKADIAPFTAALIAQEKARQARWKAEREEWERRNK